jgi:hypothetical protein
MSENAGVEARTVATLALSSLLYLFFLNRCTTTSCWSSGSRRTSCWCSRSSTVWTSIRTSTGTSRPFSTCSPVSTGSSSKYLSALRLCFGSVFTESGSGYFVEYSLLLNPAPDLQILRHNVKIFVDKKPSCHVQRLQCQKRFFLC